MGRERSLEYDLIWAVSRWDICHSPPQIPPANLLAGIALLERGYAPGDRIAIHWSNSIEAMQLLLAIFRAGMIGVPINLRLKSAEIAYILEHSAARLCFSEPALATLAEEARCSRGPDIVRDT